MITQAPDNTDYDPGVDDPLHDIQGNPIDRDYIDKVNHEAEVGYDLDSFAPARVGRPSLSDAGDSPQVRFRLPATIWAEAAALAALERKTLSQVASDAVEAYLTAHKSA